MTEVRNWLGRYLPIFVGKFGWLAALITVVVIVLMVVGTLWLFGVDVAGMFDKWTGG